MATIQQVLERAVRIIQENDLDDGATEFLEKSVVPLCVHSWCTNDDVVEDLDTCSDLENAETNFDAGMKAARAMQPGDQVFVAYVGPDEGEEYDYWRFWFVGQTEEDVAQKLANQLTLSIEELRKEKGKLPFHFDFSEVTSEG